MFSVDIILVDIIYSSLRWFLGLTIGSILGLLLASIGQIKQIERKGLRATHDFFRAIPIIGLIPLVQMNIGVNEYAKVGLIAWGVMFPVWIAVKSAMEKGFRDSELMLHGINQNPKSRFKIYVLPKLLGGLAHGVEIGIGIAWLCVVAAEWIGTYTTGFWSGGLGYRLLIEYENNNWAELHSCLIIFGLLGILSTIAWNKALASIIGKLNGFDFIRWLKNG